MSSVPVTAPPLPRCKLDMYAKLGGDTDDKDVREYIKATFGIGDAQIDSAAIYARAYARNAFRKVADDTDLTQCRAVKVDRALGILQIVVAGVTVASLLYMLWSRGSDWSYLGFGALSWAGMAVLLLQLRHVISLGWKLTWFGFGGNTRAQVVLSVLTTVLGIGVTRLGSMQASRGLVLLLIAAIGAKMYFMYNAVAHPEAPYIHAGLAFLDRIITAKRMTRLRNFYNSPSTPDAKKM